MNIVLIGFQRVGKSYFGKKLAQKLARPFIDSDELLVADQFKSTAKKEEVHEIFQRLGEAQFRVLEQKIIENNQISNAIFAVGGGAIVNPVSLKILKSSGMLIYLSLCKEKVYENLQKGRIPNYLNAQAFERSFEEMYQKRWALYKESADTELNITDLTDEAVLDALCRVCLSC